MTRAAARLAGACAVLAGVACRDTPPAAAAPAVRSGQWIWSNADLAEWRAARTAVPALRPGLWVSTVRWNGTALDQRLALDPGGLGAVSGAIVVRLDASVDEAWAALPDSVIARQLDLRLARLLPLVARAGGRADEVQLDYDAPVRRLARWAAVVRALAAPGGALAGREVWVTSLVAHAREPRYGALFHGAVRGHIVQLFDTGDEPSAAAADQLARWLARARLPFRVGVGAFERVRRGGGTTDHRGWFAALPALSRVPGFAGVWVFPGGRTWRAYRSEVAPWAPAAAGR